MIATVPPVGGHESLKIRRVSRPQSAGPAGAASVAGARTASGSYAGVPRALSPVEEKGLAHLADRAKRWGSFPDLLSHPKVDWSPDASRHAGWRKSGPRRERTLNFAGAGVDVAPRLAGVDPPETLRVAIIRIDFAADRGGSLSTGNGRFDLSNPGPAAPPVDRAPHNRRFYLSHLEFLSRYYEAQTYGGVIVTGDVWPRSQNGAYTCTDMADFEPQPDGWAFSQDIYPPAVLMFRAMMFAADTQSTKLGDRIPWDQYDRFVLIHAGSDLQSDVRQDSRLDIPSFTIGVVDTDRVIFSDYSDRPIDRAAIVPETSNQDDYFGAINGVLTHECGHLFFGFSDLYDTDTGLPRVGLWSLMDSGNLVGSIVVLPDETELFATGLLPPSVDPFQRSQMYFNSPPRLRFQGLPYGQTVSLASGERYPDMRVAPLSSDEFLILENRYLAPEDSVELDQDDSTRVVLGPKKPDRYEYDALLPGGGILAWHVDLSVIPNEYFYPCDTARANEGCGLNTNPARLAVDVIEADGLDDLGDLNSPFLLGAPRDPWYRSNNPTLSDTTRPPLRPHIGTRPHLRIDFLDEPDSTMRVTVYRTWQLPAWPIPADLPAGGPELLAVDVNGDGKAEVCWAGGSAEFGDPLAIYAVQSTGDGVHGASPLFSSALDQAPLPLMAALPRDAGGGTRRPVFAVTTRIDEGAPSPADGRVWLIDDAGNALPGWPAALPALATTPPVLVAVEADTFVYVGCEDGRVRALGLDGVVRATSEPALTGPIRGRLAVHPERIASATGAFLAVAAGGSTGEVGVFRHVATAMAAAPGWPQVVGTGGFAPDFLWIDFGIAGPRTATCAGGTPTLIAHHADALWAFCLEGGLLPGWGRDVGDTLVAGLGVGDPDGDGVPEVLTQSVTSQVAFWNASGYPAPGWPRHGSRERFRTGATPLAVDLDGDGSTNVVAMNASGIVDGFGSDGRQSDGWPLATGIFAAGTPVIADLDGDGSLEVVAPDGQGALFAYSVPTPATRLARGAWPMSGGDPGRTSALPAARSTTPPAPTAGPLIAGSLKAYPNPARRKPVSFAYTLTEPADVEFRVLDASGHEVASFVRSGLQTDNVEVWDPGALPAGLYVARLRFRGRTSEGSASVPVGLLR